MDSAIRTSACGLKRPVFLLTHPTPRVESIGSPPIMNLGTRHNARAHKAAAAGSVLLSALTSIACGPSTADQNIEPVYDTQTGRLRMLKYDSDGDGQPDTLSYMDGARVLRIELDRDEDGRVERWEYYDADQKLEKVGFSRAGDGKEDAWSYARSDGSIARIDMSLARDGKVTRREYYENDAVARAEEDGDGDGAFDKWETYADGRLASVAFDTLQRGKPDRRLLYGPDGSALLELDLDGDGTFVAAR